MFMIAVMDDGSLSRSSSRLVTSTARSTTEQKQKGKCGGVKQGRSMSTEVLGAFSMFFLNEWDNNLANLHLAIIERDLYMYIFAWLHKKSRASYKHSEKLRLPPAITFILSAGKKPPWTFSACAGNCVFCREGSGVTPFPVGSAFSTPKYITHYSFYKSA